MRVAMIVESFPSGSETFICRQIRALQSDVLAVRMDPRDLDGWDWRPRIFCLRRESRRSEPLWAKVLRRFREALLGVPAPRWSADMQSLWDEYVQERKPDVALAQYGPNGIRSMDACRRAGVPLVVYFHGYDASSLLRFPAYRKELIPLFRTAAAVVAASRHLAGVLGSLGCPADKLVAIPCGVPLDEFPPSCNQERQPCRFLAVGRFVPKKGPLLTLQAFAKCLEACPGVSLAMTGDGPLLAKARRFVQNAGIGAQVRCAGFQPNAAVREEMQNAGVFVQHSVTAPNGDIEASPVSVAEAAASALPIVSTRHGGIPDQVVEGETGFLVAEKDWKAMADRMIELARDPNRRRQMGLAGRRHMERVGSFTDRVEQLADTLRTAAQSAPRRAS